MDKKVDISSAGLHVMAMFMMLLDHMWATVIKGNNWMTCVGRIAFPIFAFLIVEGFFYTKNVKAYMGRLLIFAVISEIPFNLITEGRLYNPFHQNVLWTFVIALFAIRIMSGILQKGRNWKALFACGGISLVAVIAGYVGMVDYFGAGVLTVFVFYFFRGRKWWQMLLQAASLYWINWELLKGLVYEVTLFGLTLEIPEQGLAVLALIPIWLYHGRQGYHPKWFQYFCYAFYPVHMLIFALAALY